MFGLGHPRAASSTAVALAKKYGPWVVAAVVLLWISRSISWRNVWLSFEHVPLGPFLAASAVLLTLNCAADSLAMYFTFGWFRCRLPYREIFVVRAATYLLAVVQYYVGQAAILGYLHRRRGVPFWRGAGWILFISGINMAVLVLLAALGLTRSEIPIRWLRAVPATVGIGAVVYGLVLAWKPRRLASLPVLAPLFEMGIVGHIKATLIRLPHVLVLVVWHYFSIRYCFGVAVPPLVALVYLPTVFFFAALPVSVQGLGLSQWAAVTLFARYAPGGDAAPVMAYSLAMTGISLVVQITMGLGFLRAAQRIGLEEPQEEAMVDEAAPSLEPTHR